MDMISREQFAFSVAVTVILFPLTIKGYNKLTTYVSNLIDSRIDDRINSLVRPNFNNLYKEIDKEKEKMEKSFQRSEYSTFNNLDKDRRLVIDDDKTTKKNIQ